MSLTISWRLFKLMSFESVMPSSHLLCRPFLLLPSVFPSIRVNVSALHIRWPKYWSFKSSISPSNEYSGLISFKIDLFDLLAIQGALKNLPAMWKTWIQFLGWEDPLEKEMATHARELDTTD